MMVNSSLSLGQSLAVPPPNANSIPAGTSALNKVEDLSEAPGNLTGDSRGGGGAGNTNPYTRLLEEAKGDPV